MRGARNQRFDCVTCRVNNIERVRFTKLFVQGGSPSFSRVH